MEVKRISSQDPQRPRKNRMNRNHLSKGARPSVHSAPGVLIERLRENSIAIVEDDETDELEDELSDFIVSTSSVSQSGLDRKYQLMDSIKKKEEKQKKRATVIVTGGALTFIIMAAALVTTSFLMSPVIEEIFGKFSVWQTFPFYPGKIFSDFLCFLSIILAGGLLKSDGEVILIGKDLVYTRNVNHLRIVH